MDPNSNSNNDINDINKKNSGDDNVNDNNGDVALVVAEENNQGNATATATNNNDDEKPVPAKEMETITISDSIKSVDEKPIGNIVGSENKTIDKVAEPLTSSNTMVMMEETFEKFQQWPAKALGYRELLWYLGFKLLYAIMILMQLNVGASYMTDSAIRSALSSATSAITTQRDFWDFLLDSNGQGLVSDLFQERNADGSLMSPQTMGYYLTYNKIVGGVLIVQTRGVKGDCAELVGSTVYSSFYPWCYTEDTVQDAMKNATANTTLPVGFAYNPKYDGYSVFLGSAQGRAMALTTVQQLRKQLWTDKQTRTLTIKFPVYNAYLGVFSFCSVKFKFGIGGVFINRNAITVQSFNLEPYRSAVDYVRLLIELAFIVWLSKYIAQFVIAMMTDYKYIFRPWGLLHATHLSLLVVIILLRIELLFITYNNPIQVPTSEYQSVLEDVAGEQHQIIFVNFFVVVIAFLRMFSYFRFQQRLRFINTTLSIGRLDLLHYIIMFAVIFFGFTVMSHIIFGSQVEDFSSFGRSAMSLVRMIFGDFNMDNMDYAAGGVADFFLLIYSIFLILVLINILLAIIVDSYSDAVSMMNHDEEVMNDTIKAASDVYLSLRTSNAIQDDHIVNAMRTFKNKKSIPLDDLARVLREHTVERHRHKINNELLQLSPCLVLSQYSAEQVQLRTVQRGYQTKVLADIQDLLRENAILRQAFNISAILTELKQPKRRGPNPVVFQPPFPK